jgi:hypothetical protein
MRMAGIEVAGNDGSLAERRGKLARDHHERQ